ncbi:hypothetical protein DFH09DRAFT_1471673 [Mycena vulgaris]|nr:hypothetical protein DFH09DRAFT_1471673 [Mycena vulgaris]
MIQGHGADCEQVTKYWILEPNHKSLSFLPSSSRAMPSTAFFWNNLKEETLLRVCKDLSAGPETRRNRDGMVAFLRSYVASGGGSLWGAMKATTLLSACKDLGAGADARRNRDVMAAFLEGVSKGCALAGSNAEKRAAVPKAASVTSAESEQNVDTGDLLSSDYNVDVDSDFDLDAEIVGGRPTCGCQNGWLSPRLKFILHTTASVAQDLVRDTGELAGELGHVGGVYLSWHIPREHLPEGTKVAPLWVEGFAMMFEVITDIFEAGKIPTAGELERTLVYDRRGTKIAQMYMKQGADCEQVLSALVWGAKSEWEEGHFEEVHCHEEWDALPTCKKHDFNWSSAEDALVG